MGEQVQRLEELDQIEMETLTPLHRMEDREVVVVDLDLLEVPDLRGHQIPEVQEVQELLQHLQEFLLLPEPRTQ
jgi:hypothetical protein